MGIALLAFNSTLLVVNVYLLVDNYTNGRDHIVPINIAAVIISVVALLTTSW